MLSTEIQSNLHLLCVLGNGKIARYIESITLHINPDFRRKEEALVNGGARLMEAWQRLIAHIRL